MPNDIIHLMVYGTLLSNEKNHRRFCGDAVTVETAVTRGVLYDLPMGFPAMVQVEDSQVFGEAVTFPDLEVVLRRTDLLEGYDPRRPDCSMYRRVAVPVLTETSQQCITAWVYVWNGPLPSDARHVPSGLWTRWVTRATR